MASSLRCTRALPPRPAVGRAVSSNTSLLDPGNPRLFRPSCAGDPPKQYRFLELGVRRGCNGEFCAKKKGLAGGGGQAQASQVFTCALMGRPYGVLRGERYKLWLDDTCQGTQKCW